MRSIKRDIVGAFVVSADRKVLFGTSSKGGVYQGIWTVPGGGIEDGETMLDAVKREVAEEVNVDTSLFSFHEMSGPPTHGSSEKTLKSGEVVNVEMAFYNFLAYSKLPANEIPFQAGDDFGEARWFDIDSLDDVAITETMRARLPEVVQLIDQQ